VHAAPNPILELQRRVGNGAVTRLLQRAHPVGIVSTAVGPEMAYGSEFRHTIESSDGDSASLAGQTVREEVGEGQNDFGFAPPETGNAEIGAGGILTDYVETPGEQVDEVLDRDVAIALPAVIETPQKLKYESAPDVWTEFAGVDMRFILREAKAGKRENPASGLVCVTAVNHRKRVQDYERELAPRDPGWL
jgi:hypothetical protein